jgi:hypothetical protein
VEKLVRKGSLGIPKRKWEDNVLKLILEKEDGVVWTGLIWTRLGTNGGLL